MSDNIAVWRKIKQGGVLTLSVAGVSSSDIDFVAVARVLPTSGREHQWLDHQIHPGPKTLTFAANTAYSVRIGVKFLGNSSENADISAEVSTAASAVVKTIEGDSKYTHRVKGKVGDPMRRATLILLTN